PDRAGHAADEDAPRDANWASAVAWRQDVEPREWEEALIHLRGHPLQSALWGEARRNVDRIRDHRLMAISKNVPVYVIRCEERVLPFFGRIAWAPRGPACLSPRVAHRLSKGAAHCLRERAVTLLVADPWWDANLMSWRRVRTRQPRTIWIDLRAGREVVWADLHKQWRYGVGRARAVGVAVEATERAEDVKSFFALCESVSKVKGFRLSASTDLMQRLLARERNGPVEARLFLARYRNELGAG